MGLRAAGINDFVMRQEETFVNPPQLEITKLKTPPACHFGQKGARFGKQL